MPKTQMNKILYKILFLIPAILFIIASARYYFLKSDVVGAIINAVAAACCILASKGADAKK